MANRPGQGEVTLSSFPQLNLTLLGWWTVTGHDSKVVCAVFLFFSYKASQSEAEKKKCETLLNSGWWPSTFASAGLATLVIRSNEHLKDPHCQDVGVSGCTLDAYVLVQKEGHARHKPAHTWFLLHSFLWVIQSNIPIKFYYSYHFYTEFKHVKPWSLWQPSGSKSTVWWFSLVILQ